MASLGSIQGEELELLGPTNITKIKKARKSQGGTDCHYKFDISH